MENHPLPLFRETLPTPIGEVNLFTDDQGRLRALEFDEHYQTRTLRFLDRDYGPGGWTIADAPEPTAAYRALAAYFQGDLHAIDRLETATAGTPFRREVWAALRGVPAKGLTSYGELARRIGRPKAMRAVGLANGANPIAIVVPCHRVIGANGSLTGYGGGLLRKQWLLDHEAKQAAPAVSAAAPRR